MMNRSSGGRTPVEWRYLTWALIESGELERINENFIISQQSALTEKTKRASIATEISNPARWPHTYKLYLSVLGCIANFSTTYAGGSYSSATDAMSSEWHVSDTAVNVGITLYTIANSLAPLFLAPFSEINGRRPVVLGSGIAFVLAALLCAVTKLYIGMLLSRVLLGLANSTFAVVVVGVVADIHAKAEDRYFALTLFTAGAMFGNGFGPLISGFIVQNTSWRWLFGVLGLFALTLVTVLAVSFRETRGSVLLSKKAHQLNSWYEFVQRSSAEGTAVQQHAVLPQNVRWRVKEDEERNSALQMIKTSLTRPLHLLLTEPVVFWFSLWASFSWSIAYAMLVVVPYTFQTVYGFDLQTSSAVFAAMCIASVLMVPVSGFHDKITRLALSKKRMESPEGVLYAVACESVLLPVGLFWFGWSAELETHWIVPALGLACTTMGMFSIYVAVYSYLASAYRQYASSANAVQSMMRNLMGGTFPLFSRILFQRLGFGGACSLLGGVGVVLTAVPWVLILYGPKIRARSKRAFQDGGEAENRE